MQVGTTNLGVSTDAERAQIDLLVLVNEGDVVGIILRGGVALIVQRMILVPVYLFLLSVMEQAI